MKSCPPNGAPSLTSAFLPSVKPIEPHALAAPHSPAAAVLTVVAVTQVAAEHGFLHMGNFAAQYQRRFGERPVETLKTPCAVVPGAVQSPRQSN